MKIKSYFIRYHKKQNTIEILKLKNISIKSFMNHSVMYIQHNYCDSLFLLIISY